jgi:hypothetical protein
MWKLLWIVLVIVMSGASAPIIAQSIPAPDADSVPECLPVSLLKEHGIAY